MQTESASLFYVQILCFFISLLCWFLSWLHVPSQSNLGCVCSDSSSWASSLLSHHLALIDIFFPFFSRSVAGELLDSFLRRWRLPFCLTACKRRMLSESESGLAALRLTASSRGMTALWCSLCLSFLLPLCVTPARLPTAQPTGRKQYQTLAYLHCSKSYSTVHTAAMKTPVIVLKEIQSLDHRHQKNPTCVFWTKWPIFRTILNKWGLTDDFYFNVNDELPYNNSHSHILLSVEMVLEGNITVNGFLQSPWIKITKHHTSCQLSWLKLTSINHSYAKRCPILQ